MLSIAVTQQVECVKGCGENDVVAIGLVVAMLSLAASIAAWQVAKHALGISEDSLDIARAEHREFLRRVRAQADFDLSVGLFPPVPDDVIETTQDKVALTWRVAVENSGDKAATNVGFNFLYPFNLQDAAWVSAHGVKIPDPKLQFGPLSTEEELRSSDGMQIRADYLIRVLDRVSLREARVGWVQATVETPAVPGTEIIVPVKFKVWSDELPDDAEARWVEFEAIVRRI